MKNKVCHITTVHPTMDDRIFYKECVALAAAGFEVTLIGPDCENTVIQGVKIVSLPRFTSRLARFIKGNYLAFTYGARSGCSLVHFHDPELMPSAVLMRLSGKKVIYDVHENISQQIRYKPWLKPPWLRLVVSWLTRQMEQFCCLFFQGIVTATEDISLQFNPLKTVVVRNFPLMNWVDAIKTNPSGSEKTCLVYAGGLTRIRGIKEIIEAVGRVNEPLELWLMGDFESEDYMKECASISGWEKVKYLGMLPLKQVYENIARADIGFAMLYPAVNYLRSLPVKAFEYMAFGKPMIMSDFPYWQEVFGSAALFASPENVEDIAEKIRILLYDKPLRQRLGEHGRKIIQQEFSWEAEKNKLTGLYSRLLYEN
ncbi:MAG: glycosyltransferase [Bacteroidetes bacterium]|nr:glycosyltransferase [Bacteroidota bacterium]